jgi:hypothetical protein
MQARERFLTRPHKASPGGRVVLRSILNRQASMPSQLMNRVRMLHVIHSPAAERVSVTAYRVYPTGIFANSERHRTATTTSTASPVVATGELAANTATNPGN